MAITIRRILSVVGQVGIYACLCAGLSQGQTRDKPGTAASLSLKSSTIKIDLPELVYPYYEWIDTETALAWSERVTGRSPLFL